MSNSALYPPDCQHLSDRVNGNVEQRRQSSSDRQNSVQNGLSGHRSVMEEPSSSSHTNPQLQNVESTDSLYSVTIPWYATLDDKSDGEVTEPINVQSPKVPSSSPEAYSELSASVLALINQAVELKRMRRRVFQRRYRKRLEEKAQSLDVDVFKLKDEFRKLNVQHQVHRAAVPRVSTPWCIVAEYWERFRNGLKTPSTVPAQSSSTIKNFLHAVMSPDVSVNAGFGVEVLLEDWRVFSLNLGDLEIRLLRLEYGEGDELVANVRGTATITKKLLLNEFPHLLTSGEGQKWSSTALTLLGQQRKVYTTMCFDWDVKAARIVSAHYISDLVTPLLSCWAIWKMCRTCSAPLQMLTEYDAALPIEFVTYSTITYLTLLVMAG